MDINAATQCLGALAQPTRLEAFRLLVRQGADGLPAGQLAEALEVPHNTLSSHLSVLVGAGLLASERQGRSIRYRVDFDGTRVLLGFLLEDCCGGGAAACNAALDTVLPGCCESP